VPINMFGFFAGHDLLEVFDSDSVRDGVGLHGFDAFCSVIRALAMVNDRMECAWQQKPPYLARLGTE